jgi:hypothetical protein
MFFRLYKKSLACILETRYRMILPSPGFSELQNSAHIKHWTWYTPNSKQISTVLVLILIIHQNMTDLHASRKTQWKIIRCKFKVPLHPSDYAWEKRTLYLHITNEFRYHVQEIHKNYNCCVVLIVFIPHLLIFFKEEMVKLNTYNMTCINR